MYFAISNLEPYEPESAFSGYAFQEREIVIGQTGAEEFEGQTGAKPISGHDGCYSFYRADGPNIVAGCDAVGHFPLFYYCVDSVWAISNSFYAMATLLKRHNRLEIDYPATLAFTAGGYRYPLTYECPAKNVFLVPIGHDVILRDGHLRLQRQSHANTSTGYFDLVRKGIEKWLGVINSIREHADGQMIFHLSGGLDSRTSIAFGLSDYSGEKKNIDVLTNKPGPNAMKGIQRDWEVAHQIASRLGLNLVQSLPSNAEIGPEAILDQWRMRDVGYYADPRFSAVLISDRMPVCGGSGGEYLRHQRPSNPNRKWRNFIRSRFIAGHLARFPTVLAPEHYAMQQRLTKLFNSQKAILTPIRREIAYFSEFRGRSHYGTSFRKHFRVDPLTGKDFRNAIRSLFDNAIDRKVIFGDIITALRPELLDFDFDTEGKRPAVSYRANRKLAGLAPREMRVFGNFEQPINATDARGSSELERRKLVAREAVRLSEDQINRFFHGKTKAEFLRIQDQLARGEEIAGHVIEIRALHSIALLNLLLD